MPAAQGAGCRGPIPSPWLFLMYQRSRVKRFNGKPEGECVGTPRGRVALRGSYLRFVAPGGTIKDPLTHRREWVFTTGSCAARYAVYTTALTSDLSLVSDWRRPLVRTCCPGLKSACLPCADGQESFKSHALANQGT